MGNFHNVEQKLKARKSHTCMLCRDTIETGEVYSRQTGMFEGEFYCHKLHLLCSELINNYCIHYQEWEYTRDAVLAWLRDKWCYGCEERGICELSVPVCSIVLEGEEAE